MRTLVMHIISSAVSFFMIFLDSKSNKDKVSKQVLCWRYRPVSTMHCRVANA